MESALIKLKQRNDELTAKTRDLTDAPTSPTSSSSPTAADKTNEEFEQIKDEVEIQNRDHNERIVEMVSLSFFSFIFFSPHFSSVSFIYFD